MESASQLDVSFVLCSQYKLLHDTGKKKLLALFR